MIIVNGVNLNADVYSILLDVRRLSNGLLAYMDKSGVDDIKLTCPFHSNGAEKRPSCFIRVSDGVWHCFTCGQSGRLESLVAKCLRTDIQTAASWLVKNYSDGSLQTATLPKLSSTVHDNCESYIDESILNNFESYHPYMTKRKLTSSVIKEFDIKYDQATKSIVFPVRDRKGRLIALTKRSVEGKRFDIQKGFDKKNIYAIDKIDFSKPVYLVESQINCLTIWGYGKQAMALFGCGCTKEQIDVLNKLPVQRYIIALDNDEAGRAGTKRLCKYIKRDKFVSVVLFNDSRDVNDLSKDEFENLSVIDRFVYLN